MGGTALLLATVSSCRACHASPDSASEVPDFFVGVPRDPKAAIVRDRQGDAVGALADAQLFESSDLEILDDGSMRLRVSGFGYGAWIDASHLDFCPSRLDMHGLEQRVLAQGHIERIVVSASRERVSISLTFDLYSGSYDGAYTCPPDQTLPRAE